MKAFAYHRAAEAKEAADQIANQPGAKFLGGGTNLIDLMKMGVEAPGALVDVNRLPLAQIEELPDNAGVRLGALVRNSDAAAHPLIQQRFPVLSQAILAGASPQLRNLATTAGNLLQRTRCPYFYDSEFPSCNKRIPGSGCGALEGFNRSHAVLGQSEHCIATHPSDMCVALAALDATVQVRSQKGERQIPIGDFHRLPGDDPSLDTTLAADELIVAVDLPAAPWAAKSHYLKIRDRASYSFALVSVAAALQVEDGKITAARIALGGVAHKPWRASEAEATLVGQAPNPELFRLAGKAALAGARGYEHNQFKIELAQRCIARALTTLSSAA